MGNEIAGRGEVLLYSDESGKEYVGARVMPEDAV